VSAGGRREKDDRGGVDGRRGGAIGDKGPVMVRARSIWFSCVTLGVVLTLLSAGRTMVF
jgi:hypothetical protein